MPFERFEKLAPAKRERILEVAAQEFAANGFEGASVNRILERAQMSIHRQPLLRSFEQPWLFAVIRAAGQLPPEQMEREPLASLARQIISLVMQLVERGQELGSIRRDLPVELIFAWLQGLDGASDQWLTSHWSQLDRATIARVSDQTVEAMRRTLVPEASE